MKSRALLGGMFALCLGASAFDARPASACGTAIREVVDNHAMLVSSAEKQLDDGKFEAAAAGVSNAFPGLKLWKPGTGPLADCGLRILAMAVARKNGGLTVGAFQGASEKQKAANLEWSIASLRGLNEKRQNNPSYQTDLGEALSKVPAYQRRGPQDPRRARRQGPAHQRRGLRGARPAPGAGPGRRRARRGPEALRGDDQAAGDVYARPPSARRRADLSRALHEKRQAGRGCHRDPRSPSLTLAAVAPRARRLPCGEEARARPRRRRPRRRRPRSRSPPPSRRSPPGDPVHGKALVEKFECSRCHEGTGTPAATFEKQCFTCHVKIVSGEFKGPKGAEARWHDRVLDLKDVPSLTSSQKRFRRGWLARFLLDPTTCARASGRRCPGSPSRGGGARHRRVPRRAGRPARSPTPRGRRPRPRPQADGGEGLRELSRAHGRAPAGRRRRREGPGRRRSPPACSSRPTCATRASG